MEQDKIEATLRLYGIRPSYHRIRVYQYLLDNKNHPNADMIFQELAAEIPTLAKATVYNTLNLFVDRGLVQMLGIVENEARFDADIGVHGHFRCLKCGSIRDLHFKINLLDLIDIGDCSINESHIYFKGYCARCNISDPDLTVEPGKQSPD